METTVDSLDPKEVGRRSGSGGRPFALPEEGGSVVRERLGGAFMDVETLHSCVMVEDTAGKFDIGVRDGAMWIFERNQRFDNFRREPCAPNDRCSDVLN
jgi:hypothetical protein